MKTNAFTRGELFGHLSIRTVMLLAAGFLAGISVQRFLPEAGAAASDTAAAGLRTGQLEVVGAGGSRGIVMGMSVEGTPGMWFFDKLGRARLAMGVYEDGNASIVLNDENGQAVQIFRTVGPKSDPVLVMKAEGRDRIVLGLNGKDHDPFFVVYDQAGTKETLFGSFNQ